MRKLVFLLFPALAALSVLGCSNNDDMPCLDCYEGESPYAYCLTYNSYSGYQECSYMPVALCTPNYGVMGPNYGNYGHDHTCGGYLRSSSSSRPVSSSSFSSSSSRPGSSSSSRPSSSSNVVEYTGGSCNASDYGTVNIGGQVWMAKNWGCYVLGSKCYNNDPDNCTRYGRLYDWSTAMGGSASSTAIPSGVRGVCPLGWHLPSKGEWDVLSRFIWNSQSCNSCAAEHLKAKDGWNSCGPSGSGKSYSCEDTYEFSALPGGYGYLFGSSDGIFGNAGYYGNWWSASEYDSLDAYYRSMGYYDEGAFYDYYGKSYLFSVRCLQD